MNLKVALELGRKKMIGDDVVTDLCDGTNTTKSIAQTIGKDETYVRANSSVLRREGLVRTVKKEGKQVHDQIF